ncbi:heterokaryon incompatibility protein 6, OR allele [Achaetomium macrosporum]|uniref:Heterokaryon incompatibility protein 6, OR allele n=1 Tax=Achaetomium macrosporum TaxID=79813 RepID=A0AAN7H512_9PEZI|nr:heterokaryon incompatibility protein 6, OR allele [Achaetomium macrosporum]
MLPDFRSLPEFRYKCLATRSLIRVLNVEALDDTTADVNPNLIKLRIDEVELDENLEFNALSYVWGDHRAPLGQDNSRNRAKRSFKILCNGQTMSVTYNLFCFLRRLSSARQGALKDIRGMPLWVDQLCINQSDNAERTVQVAMMDRVYAQAGKVVSWLGESDFQIDGAVRLLGRLKDVPLGRVTSPNFDVAQLVKDIPNDDWLALGALVSRPYFKRAWIVQEIAMAKELLIVCGDYELRWDDLAHCSAILETSRAWTMLSRYASVFRSVQDHVAPDGQRRESLHYGGQLAALVEAQSTIRNPLVAPESLLLLGKQFDATVPADKYFAMLGLYRNRLGVSASTSDLLSVDYSKSLKHVALDFARYHIQASGSLRILSLVEDAAYRSPASAEFPSWLPDPTAPLRPLPLDTERWGTAQAHFPRKPPRVEGDSLHVQGNKLTTITLTATPFSTLQQTHEWFYLFDFLSTSAQPPSNIPLDTALWRTLTTTPLPHSPKSPDTAPPNLADDFAAWCISLASSVRSPINAEMVDGIMAEAVQQSYRIDDIQFDGLAFGKDAASIFESELTAGSSLVDEALRRSEIRYTYMDRREKAEREGLNSAQLGKKIEDALKRVWKVCVSREKQTVFPDPRRVRKGLEVLDHFAEDRMEERRDMQHRIDRFLAAVGTKLDGRKLFFTEDGQLGIGPESLCNGDEVWEIDGMSVPAVIRRVDSGAFRYVGETFVLGLTPGEGVASRTDVSQLVDLVLK